FSSQLIAEVPMHFDYTEEHEMLRDATRGFVERHDPIALFREGLCEGARQRRANYGQMAEQGWTAMLLPEDAGGFGSSLVEAMVVAEELGRGGHGAAFIGTNVSAAAIARAGTLSQRADILPGLVAGELI